VDARGQDRDELATRIEQQRAKIRALELAAEEHRRADELRIQEHLLQLLLNNTSEKKVGIVIEPSQVRLVTGADDLYTWKVLPQKKHLFSKNISDYSIGAYKELCEGIDSAFEAAR
jgi:hypothetical protein